jgi:hypothetical protein
MAISVTGALRRLAGDVLEVAYGRDDGDRDSDRVDVDTYEQARLRQTVRKLRRAFEEGSKPGGLDEVVTVLVGVVRDGRVGLLAWLDLVEEIVQVTERRFGTRPGQGEFKAGQAKAAVRRLMQRTDTRSAAFVELVGPFTIDLFAGWFIDLTVAMLNKNRSLWDAGAAAARIPLRTRVLARLVRWLSRVLAWFSERPALDPRLSDEVDRLAQSPANPLVLVDRVVELGDWLIRNREQTLALVDLVSAACDEVEYFQSLHGSEAKQTYARNLVIATLEEAGLELRTPGLEIAEAATDFMIDFVVHTNNKRGRYPHVSAPPAVGRVGGLD